MKIYIILFLFFSLVIMVTLYCYTNVNIDEFTDLGYTVNNTRFDSYTRHDSYTRPESCTNHMNDTLTKVITNTNMVHSTDNKNPTFVFPCSYNDIDKEISDLIISSNMQNIFIISRADELAGKDRLWSNLVNHHGLTHAKTLAPNSYILADKNDLIRLEQEYNPNKKYILKKNVQRQEGLKIVSSLDDILKNKDYVVAQELLDNPYIIPDSGTNGSKGSQNLSNYIKPIERKINMRFYILFICKNKQVSSYVYNNGFVYYTKNSFDKTSMDPDSNITTGYIDRDIYDRLPLTLQELRKYLDNNDRDLNIYEKNIRNQNLEISSTVFDRIYSLLKQISVAYSGIICQDNKLKNNNSFQLFGADIALNNELYPQIMELNKGPDLGSKDERDGIVKYNCLSDMFSLLRSGLKAGSNTNSNTSYNYVKLL